MDIKLRNIAYLLLGTNLGDRINNLKRAIEKVEMNSKVVLRSKIYTTAAWGIENQSDFLNQVVCIHTEFDPQKLLENVLDIEQQLGRERLVKWGSRIIDIDVLYFNDEIIETPKLIIPHPQIHNRRFTLIPLVELNPDYIHPKINKSNLELLEICSDTLSVKKCFN